jgi:adenine-specific DNA-methyltransferase
MEKLKLHSPDLTQANIEKLGQLFPNCVSEARDADGSVKRSIDFDQLRQELSDSIVEGQQERYQLNWPGKREALLTANAPIAKTLRPCRAESVNFENTQNLFIEGDNLDALKLLQETYLNKVKMIYIDPPYNTGNDFVYEDDFAEDSNEYFIRSNQKDDHGNRMVANTDSNGRFHSDWLSMIYPRLRLARSLLRDDGAIFISSDDGEIANLRKVCDEVFGEHNFLANVVWEKVHTRKNSTKYFSTSHEHILAYAKEKSQWDRVLLPREGESAYKNPDNHPKGPWKLDPITAHNEYSAQYKITKPNGTVLSRPQGRYWAFSEESIKKKIANDEIVWGEGDGYPMIKRFLSETQDGLVPITIFDRKFAGDTTTSKKEVDDLFQSKSLFDYAKPTLLIKRLLQISSRPNDIVLDFFAGSASTADAVMQLNSADGGNRRFIMVQLPELCDVASDAFKAGFKTIAEISKERIRLAGKKVSTGQCHKGWSRDIGFRVLKIDSSNMKEVFYTPDAVSQDLLSDQVNNIREDRTPEDLLFQVLLDWGVDLALPITQESIAGKAVYFVDGNALAACFEEGVSEEFVKQLAKREPLRVVFRDAGFANDSVKINVEQIFKLMSPTTDIKTI